MIFHITPLRGTQSYACKRRSGPVRPRLDFQKVSTAARANALQVCQQLLPGGKREGNEYVVRNPKRADTKPGSFKINLRSGRWADFALGVGGGDLISLTAYILDIRQGEAAKRLAAMLHVSAEVHR
jgi:hypothetical protein